MSENIKTSKALNIGEFARCTGRSIADVENLISDGSLPFAQGGFKDRYGDGGSVRYVHLISEDEVARFRVPGADKKGAVDPRTGNDEIRRQAAAKATQIRQDEIAAGTDANLVASKRDERAARELTIRAFKGGLGKDMPEPSTQGFSTAKPDF